MRNVAKTYVTKVDSNASLQKSDPEHYGPYLEEGGSYQTPRTAENVEMACKEMGVCTMMDDSEQEFFPKFGVQALAAVRRQAPKRARR